DFQYDARRKRLVCVCEDHSGEAGQEPVNCIVAVDADGGEPTVLVTGHDFYSSPRLSPDGAHLAWLAWNHPDMPWDGTELWVSPIDADGNASAPDHITGGTGDSIFQPEWSPEGLLHFVSDRTGYWNLYAWRSGEA